MSLRDTNKILSLIGIACVIAMLPVYLGAQPQNPQTPDSVPITGLEYLIISGGILGGYKLWKKRKIQD